MCKLFVLRIVTLFKITWSYILCHWEQTKLILKFETLRHILERKPWTKPWILKLVLNPVWELQSIINLNISPKSNFLSMRSVPKVVPHIYFQWNYYRYKGRKTLNSNRLTQLKNWPFATSCLWRRGWVDIDTGKHTNTMKESTIVDRFQVLILFDNNL